MSGRRCFRQRTLAACRCMSPVFRNAPESFLPRYVRLPPLGGIVAREVSGIRLSLFFP